MDRDEMSNLYRTLHRCFLPSFNSFGSVVSEEKIFKIRPIRNKNCLWRPCLLMDRDEMSNHYRGPSIDASYQVSIHLAEGFQRRRLKMWKVNGRQTTNTKWWQKLTLPLASWAKNSQNTIGMTFLILFLKIFFDTCTSPNKTYIVVFGLIL